jgi:hypothetical protein
MLLGLIIMIIGVGLFAMLACFLTLVIRAEQVEQTKILIQIYEEVQNATRKSNNKN